MIFRLLLLFLFILNFCFGSFANSAEIFKSEPIYTDLSDTENPRKAACSYNLLIKGIIVKGDSNKFTNIVQEIKQTNSIIRSVHLSSSGGDINEAIKIGLIIRKNLMYTSAPQIQVFENKPQWNEIACIYRLIFPKIYISCTCNSSCFLIWAAGVVRQGNFIGLHRPYFSKEYFKNLSSSEATVKYKELSKAVRNYLISMDIPNDIIDKMFSRSSENIYFLFEHFEDGDIGSITLAPSFEEWIIAKCGTRLTSEENMALFELERKETKKEKLTSSERIALKFLREKSRKLNKCVENAVVETQLGIIK